MADIAPGSRGTCKGCGKLLVRVKGVGHYPTNYPDDQPNLPSYMLRNVEKPMTRMNQNAWDIRNEYTVDHWEASDDPSDTTCPVTLNFHKSREYCEHTKQAGGLCGKQTDRDNWTDDVYACGVHTKIEVQEVNAAKARQRRELERVEAEELREMIQVASVNAHRWLLAHGWAELISPQSKLPDPSDETWQKTTMRRYHEADINLLELQDYLERMGYDGPATSGEPEQQDLGQVSASTPFD